MARVSDLNLLPSSLIRSRYSLVYRDESRAVLPRHSWIRFGYRFPESLLVPVLQLKSFCRGTLRRISSPNR
jgi:hypothetical protein